MIARLGIVTPFVMVVPDATKFQLYTYDDSGFHITVRPPTHSDAPFVGEVPDTFKINDAPAYAANALNIDFGREHFERKQGAPMEPSAEVVDRALGRLVGRLRYVTRGSMVRSVNLTNASWRLRYLTDDGNEFPETAGLIRGFGGRARSFSYAGVDLEVWERIHDLPPTWESPPWDDILLDATAALPMLGPAVVLAATALEVFIASTLSRISAKGTVAPALWEWINNRGNWLKDPSVGEQFDFLLSHLAGHSLKENAELWEAFRNLRQARNNFVHEGRVAVGKANLSEQDVIRLIGKCSEIIVWVKQWVPVDLQWPSFGLKTQIEATFRMI